MQWYKLSPEQIQKLKEFQRIMEYLYDMYFNRSTHTKEKLQQFEQLIANDLGEFPFLQAMDQQIKQVLVEVEKINPQKLKDLNQQLLDSQTQFADFFDNLEQGIVTDFGLDDVNQLLEESKASGRPIYDIVNTHLREYITVSTASLFFSGGKRYGLLSSFDKKDWQELVKQPIPKYSYLKWPENGSAEQYIYFIQKLSDKGEKINLYPEEFKDYLDFEYGNNPQWKKLKDLIDKYQHNNDKETLVLGLKLLKKFPELVEYHNKLKAKFKQLYRGIGLDEYASDAEIKQEEKQKKIVATTPYHSSAQNFAYGRGHLMGNVQSNDFPYMITYSVTPRDILLDTSLFGQLFGEAEVLVNSVTAKITNIELLPDVADEEEEDEDEDDY